jgi:hypothetical protein
VTIDWTRVSDISEAARSIVEGKERLKEVDE